MFLDFPKSLSYNAGTVGRRAAMKERMIIFDTDAAYARELERRLNEAEGFPFTVSAVTTKEELGEISEPYGLLLVSGQAEDTDVTRGRSGQVLYLTDVQGYHAVDTVPTIYKYQPLKMLQEEIIRKQKRVETEYSIAEKPVLRCSFVGISSPIGRCGKTGLAVVLGELLSQFAHVLYVSFEPFSGFPKMIDLSGVSDLAEAMYAFGNGECDFEKSRYTVKFHGMDILPPARLGEDILHADPEACRDFLQEFCRREHYDIVMLDLGSDMRFTERFLPVLQKLYVPTTQQAAESEKLRAFLEWVNRARGERELSVKVVTLPPPRSVCTEGAYLEQLIWSETGEFARKLVGDLF